MAESKSNENEGGIRCIPATIARTTRDSLKIYPGAKEAATQVTFDLYDDGILDWLRENSEEEFVIMLRRDYEQEKSEFQQNTPTEAKRARPGDFRTSQGRHLRRRSPRKILNQYPISLSTRFNNSSPAT
jgi:hypothetical protein